MSDKIVSQHQLFQIERQCFLKYAKALGEKDCCEQVLNLLYSFRVEKSKVLSQLLKIVEKEIRGLSQKSEAAYEEFMVAQTNIKEFKHEEREGDGYPEEIQKLFDIAVAKIQELDDSQLELNCLKQEAACEKILKLIQKFNNVCDKNAQISDDEFARKLIELLNGYRIELEQKSREDRALFDKLDRETLSLMSDAFDAADYYLKHKPTPSGKGE